jgi:predicted nucleic acid-binding protein
MPNPNAGVFMNNENADIKRTILLSARLKISPSATMREKTINRIVEQCLCASPSKRLTLDDLVKKCNLSAGIRMLRRDDIWSSVLSLENDGHITSETKGKETFYRPIEKIVKDCSQFKEEDDKRFDAVVRELFLDANGNLETYRSAFFNVLCRIFSRLTSAYVVISTKENVSSNKHLLVLIKQACQNIHAKNKDIDNDVFSKAVSRFFDERTPSFDALKWIMAQNHYNMRLLGVDQSAHLLAAEMLKDSTLYLDTNVLIKIMMPEHSRYADVTDVLKCCETINTRLLVTDITANEFTASVNKNTELVREVIKYIPRGTRNKVHSFVLEEYIVAARAEKDLTLEDFLLKYKRPMQVLNKKLPSVIVQEPDEWFSSEAVTQATTDLASLVSSKFVEMRKYNKPPLASLHDALMLRWIEQMQNATANRCLFLTLDQTLVAADKESSCARTRTIALDVLIQWIAPFCSSESQVDHLAGVYAEALRCQLLPHEQMFSLQDFEIFREMEMETDALPEEEVENCLLKIKNMFPSMDIRKPADREKIAYEIKKVFIEPVTKANKRISELNQIVIDKSESERNNEIKLKTSEAERLSEKQAREQQGIENQKLLSENLEFKRAIKESKRKWATGIASVVFLLCCVVLLFLIYKYSEGVNMFVKITGSLTWFAAASGLSIFAYRVYLCDGSWSAAFCKIVDDA